MFGNIQAKLTGLKHVWVNYFGAIPAELALYRPFNNRECLHCHQRARSYTENELHTDLLENLKDNEVSCLECHEVAHDVGNLSSLEMWKDEGEAR